MSGPEKGIFCMLSTIFLTTFFGIVTVGCSSSIRKPPLPTEDTAYLTPITTETIRAFRSGLPIENKLQAVIAARIFLDSPPHFKSLGEQKVISIEKLQLQNARNRVELPGETTHDDRSGTAQVWLVIFEGETQVLPPDPEHTITPPPPIHGCSYIILDSERPFQTGGIACPSSNPSP